MAKDGDETQLLHQAVHGDRWALHLLLLLSIGDLSAHIAKHLPATLSPFISTEDLLQETLLRVIRGIRRFESRDVASFRLWMKVIAERQIKAAMTRQMADKRSGRRRRYALPEQHGADSSVKRMIEKRCGEMDTPQRLAARAEAIEAIHDGLACLPDSQRVALRLHELDGMSIQETSEILHRSPSAVRSLIYRARQALRAVLGQSSRWLSGK